jgi:uncharacterized protein
MEENTLLNQNFPPLWLKKIGLVLLFFIFYMVFAILISYGGELILANQFGVSDSVIREMAKNESNIMLLSMLFNFGATVLVIYLFWRFVIKKDFPEIGFNDNNWIKNLILGMLCGIIAISLGFIICLIFGFVKVNSLAFSPPDFTNYFIIFAMVSISEEMMTRGLMLSTLMDGMNDYLALLLVAIIFGALHLFNDHVTTLSFINICIAGIFLGISYIHNRSLWFPIGLHFTWNFFQGPIYGYEVSGHKNVAIVSQTIHGNDTFTGGEFGFEGSIIAIPIMLVAILAIHIYYSRVEDFATKAQRLEENNKNNFQ